MGGVRGCERRRGGWALGGGIKIGGVLGKRRDGGGGMRAARLILNRGTEGWGMVVWASRGLGYGSGYGLFCDVLLRGEHSENGHQQCLDVRRSGREIWL